MREGAERGRNKKTTKKHLKEQEHARSYFLGERRDRETHKGMEAERQTGEQAQAPTRQAVRRRAKGAGWRQGWTQQSAAQQHAPVSYTRQSSQTPPPSMDQALA